MQKTKIETILIQFLKNYNEAIKKADKHYSFSYKVYVQKIPVSLEEGSEEVNCTVLEILRKTELVNGEFETAIIYEEFKPNVNSMFTSMKDRLISSFIVKGMTTLVEALNAIENGEV